MACFIISKEGISLSVYKKNTYPFLPSWFAARTSSFFCNLYASRKSRLILFLSTAFLKWRLLTDTVACIPGDRVSVSYL